MTADELHPEEEKIVEMFEEACAKALELHREGGQVGVFIYVSEDKSEEESYWGRTNVAVLANVFRQIASIASQEHGCKGCEALAAAMARGAQTFEEEAARTQVEHSEHVEGKLH